MKHFDVAIIGSGPSGTSTAYHLAKAGINTVIIEKETFGALQNLWRRICF
jgi:flavin-dependent dehydrogenase